MKRIQSPYPAAITGCAVLYYESKRIRTKYLLPHIEWLLQKQSEMEENAANLSTAE